ncbi:MAG: DUF997 family protein [Moraxella sp.]|nr:DUF997 family protein [Moraxella sp.]
MANSSPPDSSPLSSSPNPTTTYNKQLGREARWAVWLTLLYLAGWVLSAYFSPDGVGVFGFPLWFELSCLALPVLFIIVSFAVLKKVYQPIDLDSASRTNSDNTDPNQTNSDSTSTAHQHTHNQSYSQDEQDK